MEERNRILILGATGMLGHKLFLKLSEHESLEVHGTARSSDIFFEHIPHEYSWRLHCGVGVEDFHTILQTISDIEPDVVINCIGIIKQLPEAKDHITSISINSLFPHRLALACKIAGVRMIHFSTDCVFDGKKGNYSEKDHANAIDLYGRTKFLGEVEHPHCVTLRTSIIGHEIKGKHGLIEWFLSQKGKVHGFTNAIYSGFPTLEIAHIISEYVIPDSELKGLFHVSSQPISKYELLRLVAEKYKKHIEIEPYDDVRADRSLDSAVFRGITGYAPPSWPELVDNMYQDFISASYYNKKPEAKI